MNPTASSEAVGSFKNLVEMVSRLLVHIMQKGLIFLILILTLLRSLNGQQDKQEFATRQNDLMLFARQKGASWLVEKRKADSLAKVQGFPLSYIENDNRVITLQRLGRNNKPVYYATDNLSAASTIAADMVWMNDNDYPSLTGEGVAINLWDGGSVRKTHQEFNYESVSRIALRDIESPQSNHASHIGTMIASGINPDARGMANKALVKSWDYNDDLSEMASCAADGIVISNHSYGPLCGWYYNATNESWYWYGDPDISETEDYKFGFYDQESADIDFIAWNAPYYLIVKSAGNDRNDFPTSSFVHFVWDGAWKIVNVERDPDGGIDGYDCLSPMAVAKNILTVGAVDDAGAMTDFSSFGPTDDGRIKPDVVANGNTVYSSIAASDTSYGVYNGTSMATASVTGAVALLHQLQNILRPGVPLLSSTVKAILIHTATESGTSLGPDYRFGWGLLNIKNAADLISANSNNGGRNIYEGSINQGETISIPVETGTTPFMKVTICWTDPAGEPSLPSLNPRSTKLVNDLDIMIENSINHHTYLPWVLDIENPSAAAALGVNHTDNVEQVLISNPGETNFDIKISHSGSLTGGSQTYSLIVTGINTPYDLSPPQNLTYIINGSSVLLNWIAPASGTPDSYFVYRNGQLLEETINTSFNDESVTLDNIYEYFVTAVYEKNNVTTESAATNKVTAFPQALRSLPFTVDFEVEPTEINIKNTENGWLWGDSESLSCYYLDFSANTTKFIGVDSYSAGDAVHVWDIAATAPLRLGDYAEVVLSFDHLFKTGIYDAIDELHIVYKLQEETEWQDLINLESSNKWSHKSIDLPPGICINGTQIGFYYDDMYQWGLGGGVDNISITGTEIRSVDFSVQSLTAPASSCSLSDNEVVTVIIRNAGTQVALPGDIINLQMNISNEVSVTDVITLEETLNGGAILTHQMSVPVNLSVPGNYTFEFSISSEIDHNELNDQLSTVISVFGYPTPLILNSDVTFCIDEPQVIVQVSPAGGTLSGPGITGIYFNPASAGAGSHNITYSFTDLNGCDASVTRIFVVNALPQPAILNSDATFCIDEPQVIVQVSPAGGTLSGPGISGLYFSPSLAGAGSHPIYYGYTDPAGCYGVSEKQFIVFNNPSVDLGPDKVIGIGDTIKLTPTSDSPIFLWQDGSTGDNLTIIARDWGIGSFDIWVKATNNDLCSAIDSILLTISLVDHINNTEETFKEPVVYPNPFSKYFYIEIDEKETLQNISIYKQNGSLYTNTIPDSYPYISAQNMLPGYYILKIETDKHTYILRIIKFL